MTFAHPDVLWLAGLAPPAVLGLYLHDRARRVVLARRLGELPVIARAMPSASPARRAVKTTLAGAALTLIVVALARPQLAGKRQVELRGLDLVVAVDVSSSMLVADVGATAAMSEAGLPANRLGRARELAVRVIDELPGDRVAPVVFAGAAAHFPLTEDHEVAARMLYDLGPADLPQGSNLGEVFRVASCLLRPDLYDDLGCQRIGRRGHGGDPLPGEAGAGSALGSDGADDETFVPVEERGKAILIITDGGDPDPDAVREAQTAHRLGIAVIVVGVGTKQGGVVYALDAKGNASDVVKHARDGSVVVSKRDDGELAQLAEAGGDRTRMFVASVRGEVDPTPIVRALRGVERGHATKKIDEQRDVFEPFLFAALLLLVIEVAIASRRRRAYPEER